MKKAIVAGKHGSLSLIAQLVSRMGFVVVEVTDGRSALLEMEKQHEPPTLLIIERSVSEEMSNTRLIMEVKKIIPTLGVIAIVDSNYQGSAAIEGGAQAFIKNPVDNSELTKVIGSVMGQ
jgi:DNA-binding NtrC family response regulator